MKKVKAVWLVAADENNRKTQYMNTPSGVLVKVLDYVDDGDANCGVATAMTFVPGTNVHLDDEGRAVFGPLFGEDEGG